MEYLFFWVFISFLVAFLGTNKKIGYLGTFFISLILTPFIGLIIALVSSKKEAKNMYSPLDLEIEKGNRSEFKNNVNEAIDSYKNALYIIHKAKINNRNKDYYLQRRTYLENRIKHLETNLS